jgi:DNA-binding NarL/FixJ family response regulator
VRCLIVDDSASFRVAASSMLERAGFTVVGAASDGAEALKCYAETRPDVTLVDVDLGVQSGFEVTEQLHRAGLPEPTPVILISTHDEQDFVEMIAASPAVGFLPKVSLSAGAIVELLHNHGCALTEPPGT